MHALELVSPLAGLEPRMAPLGADAATPIGVELIEQPMLGLVQLSGVPSMRSLDPVRKLFRLPALRSGQMSGREGRRLLPIGPNEWWLLDSTMPLSLDMLEDALERPEITLTDLSHARLHLELRGPAVLDLLATGSGVDVEALGNDVATALQLGPFSVVLLRSDASHVELLVPRSFGRSLWLWLSDRATEFGVKTSLL